MSTLIVLPHEAARLREISIFDEMRSDEYLTNTNHIQTKFIYEKFFNGKGETMRQERLKLLNISMGLPGLIAETFADFVGEPENTLGLEIGDFVEAYSWGGYAVLQPMIVDGKFKVEYVSPDGYVKNDDGSEQLIFILLAYEGSTIQRYIFEKKYIPGRTENRLYKADTIYSYDIVNDRTNDFTVKGDEVPLTTIPSTAMIPEVELTGLSVNPIVTIHNSRLNGRRYGSSDVMRVRSMISSVEVGLVNLQDQLLKHLQAKMYLPKTAVVMDKNGIAQLDKMEVITMESGDALPGYMVNTNPLIDKEFTFIETLIRGISSRLSMPIEFFGIDGIGGAESAETRKIRLSRFLKRVNKARSRFAHGLEQIHEIGKMWGAVQGELQIVWPPIFPINKADQLDELALAVDSKLMSQRKAVSRYQDVDEQELEAELALINQENAVVPAEQLPA